MQQTAVTPLTELALTRLRDLLAEPLFVRGGRLPAEPELAARVGVSRPVLRQALSILRDEGSIESRRGSGTFVVRNTAVARAEVSHPQTLGDVADLIRFRAVLERGAAVEAARRRDPAALAEIERFVGVLNGNGSAGLSVVEADLAFHMAVARAADNSYYVLAMETLRPHILLSLQLGRQLRGIAPDLTSHGVAEEHRVIYEAIRTGDEAAAGQLMEAHLFAGMRRVFGKLAW
jgi:GntR family transcriptional repressor for pyruvate dehydrogenase complex